MSSPNTACCRRPPVVSGPYTQLGAYTALGGLKTYTTGLSTATHGILVIYDIFGYYPQTLQAADILSGSAPGSTSTSTQHYKIFMPDWFDDAPADLAMYPPVTPEQHAYITAFMTGPAAPADTLPKIPAYFAAIKEANPQITSWGVVGYCWGAKIASLLANPAAGFKAAAMLHPSLMVVEDAGKVEVPLVVLPSGDENVELVNAFKAGLTVENYVETFTDQVHGWMASRADFEDPRAKAEYLRGYGILRDFFGKYL
ncbi:dienelactone hydrolase family protein [Mytilinidion resinicola]|uniref:Dienelactone hydrolase family protein n=1 Tax=Mytilinidion resinicola TaxID=574789 RepID=A0A6A6Z755_9PEZI|nr:dienelactone hydrolase family protein [Mytilinidion resinicola]KAF2816648.1 dienelactone hydrolase family protein [Mytilinidion resinicola]